MLSICYSSGFDPLDIELFTDKTIMKVMCPVEKPWAISHHRSSFIPTTDHSELLDLELTMHEEYDWSRNPFSTKPVFVEGNLSNISTTILINISLNPNVTKNLLIGVDCSPEEIQLYTTLFKEYQSIFAWTYDEMSGIDPWIVEHEIKTYPNVKPVRQKLWAVNPRKAPAIKAEIEKLLKVGFIYPAPLTEWVSNLVAVNKKDGKIHVCTDFRDLNKACPKDNYPMSFIDQILDDCSRDEIFSFMDGFSGYNQIQIKPEHQHKTTFICPWGTFAYRKMPFGLKNARATFQRAMSYAFHDITQFVEAYLDDLVAHSKRRVDHPTHLRAIFDRYRKYKIRLNPLKCSFCVVAGRLLGFVISKHGIMVDPLKVEAILQLSPPRTIRQLQSLQGKANFLRWFITNYAEIMKGFMRLLKKEVHFYVFL
jgi:hypothetical protein